jgi:serine/threonine protein phosphatase 1
VGSGSVFAIGDIHGCADELRQLLAKMPIEVDSTVVFLGDYVDRGPDAKGVVDEVIRLKQHCRVIALRGNHEDLLLQFLDRPDSSGAVLFVLNGGSATLASYADGAGGFSIPGDHLRFFRELLACWETDRHFFVHAGVPDGPLAELDRQKSVAQMTWIRAPFLQSQYQWEKIVVHGHSPVEAPDVRPNRINLDTGCVFGMRLTALDVGAMKFYSVARPAPFSENEFYLRPAGGTRASTRFLGSAPVFLIRGGQAFEYATLNYNQFGMLIQEREAGVAPLIVGQRVIGWVGAPGAAPAPPFDSGAERFEFEGSVVRTEGRGNLALYGIRMHKVKGPDDRL